MTSRRIDPLKVEKISDLVHEREQHDLGNHWDQGQDEREDWQVYLEFVPGSYYMCDDGHTEKVDRDSELALICVQNGETAIKIRCEECPKCHEEDNIHEANGGSFHECYYGHIGRVGFGTDLEQQCIQIGTRWICIAVDECPKCQDEKKRREREYYEYDMHIFDGPYEG